MQDSFTKVIPTYHHTDNSNYHPSQTHSTHREINQYIEGNSLADKSLKYHHKKDKMKNYSEMVYVLGKDFAPQPRRPVKNSSGEHWKMNVMHSMWPISTIYHGAYASEQN
jgi:hypothetical protein